MGAAAFLGVVSTVLCQLATLSYSVFTGTLDVGTPAEKRGSGSGNHRDHFSASVLTPQLNRLGGPVSAVYSVEDDMRRFRRYG